MINKENLQLVAVYKKFEKVCDKWHCNTLKCYTNGFQYVVIIKTHGSKHCRESIFTNRKNANEFVKRYIGYGYKKEG